MFRAGPLSSLLLLLLMPSLASASTAVLYTDGVSLQQAVKGAKEAFGAEPGSFSSVAATTGTGTVIAGATARVCETVATPIGEVLRAAQDSVDTMDYDAAVSGLGAAVDGLPCGAEGVTRE